MRARGSRRLTSATVSRGRSATDGESAPRPGGRSQQFSHCRHERPRLGVAEHEAIERAHPQQHFVGAAADRLEPRSWPRWPVQRTDAAEKHGLTAGHVAHGAEQVVSDGLGSARDKRRMTMAM